MTRSELILRVREIHPDLYHRDVARIVDIIFAEIGAALARGRRVELRGFGVFRVKHLPARTSRNPRTGATVEVRRKAIPRLKVGKPLFKRLNSGEKNLSLARAEPGVLV